MERILGNKKYKKMNIAVSCYNGKISSVYYEEFDHINKKQKAIITNGHFHGTAGSGIYEYSVIKVTGKKKELNESTYFDHYPDYSVVYISSGSKSHNGTKKEYNKLYRKYVKGAQKISKFKTYSVKDMRGLSKIDH